MRGCPLACAGAFGTWPKLSQLAALTGRAGPGLHLADQLRSDFGRAEFRVRIGIVPGESRAFDRAGDLGLHVAKHHGIFEQPPREQSLRGFLEPLVEEGADLAPKICGVIEPAKFEALEGRGGRLRQVIPRRIGMFQAHWPGLLWLRLGDVYTMTLHNMYTFLHSLTLAAGRVTRWQSGAFWTGYVAKNN